MQQGGSLRMQQPCNKWHCIFLCTILHDLQDIAHLYLAYPSNNTKQQGGGLQQLFPPLDKQPGWPSPQARTNPHSNKGTTPTPHLGGKQINFRCAPTPPPQIQIQGGWEKSQNSQASSSLFTGPAATSTTKQAAASKTANNRNR